MIFQEIATVISTEEIAENTFETFLNSPKISSQTHPGQFIHILPSSDWTSMMRRPMSVASQDGKILSIIYKVVGDGTEIMKNWKKDETVDLIGPLGNSWSKFEDKFSILIGGGVGIAPILNFYSLLKSNYHESALIMGARTGSEHFIDHQPKKHIYMTTDDGSLGIEGNVLNPLESLISELSESVIKVFACGPPAMMEAVRQYCLKNKIECDLALETIMACGIGICQGCTVEFEKTKQNDHTYREQYGLVCMDGPIFSAEEIKSCHL